MALANDSAGTAAELDEIERNLRAMGAPYEVEAADALAALRKQLDEARRERDELNRSIFGLYDTCAKYRADNAKKDAALREAISLLTRERDLLDRERPNMTKSKDWRYDPPATEAELQYWEGYRRGVDLAIRTLTPASQEAPGHTDLMVAPESIDAFLEANPLPEEAPASPKDVHIEHTLATSPSPGLRDFFAENANNSVLRDAVIEECAKAYRKGSGPFTYNYSESAEAAILALLSRPVSEREGE